MTPKPVHILWVDDYHLADPLFKQSLARTLAQAPAGDLRAIIVHGSGEYAEHALEAHGGIPSRTDGILNVEAAEDRLVVERAIREANKDLTGVLTEFAVSAVGIQGTDLSLFRRGSGGEVELGRFSWVLALAETGSVPVISSLSESGEGPVEIAVETSTSLVARSLSAEKCVIVVFLKSGKPGVFEGTVHQPLVGAEDLGKHVPEGQRKLILSLLEEGYEVRLTSARHAISADPTRFTRISDENPA